MPITTMTPWQFRQFFTGVLTDETFREELARDGLAAIERRVGSLDLPDDMRAAFVSRIPALRAGGIPTTPEGATQCGTCGVCGACIFCEGINFGVAAAALGALVSVVP